MKKKIFIDTDLGFDDYFALFSVIGRTDVDIAGISITGCGEVYLDNGLKIVSNLLKYFDKNDIPVFAGYDVPTVYTNAFPPIIRDAANNAFGLSFISGEAPLVQDAVTGIIEILKNTEEKVDFILIGGGTTFSHLLKKVSASWLKSKIGTIIVMGGNILPEYLPQGGAWGNIKDFYCNKVAEFNVFIDVGAMQDVFQSGLPVTLVTLNAANGVMLYASFIEKIKNIKSKASDLSYTIIKGICETERMSLWDPICNAILFKPELVLKPKIMPLYIEQNFVSGEKNNLGKLVVDEYKGYPIDVLLTLDDNATYNWILDSLKY